MIPYETPKPKGALLTVFSISGCHERRDYGYGGGEKVNKLRLAPKFICLLSSRCFRLLKVRRYRSMFAEPQRRFLDFQQFFLNQ